MLTSQHGGLTRSWVSWSPLSVPSGVDIFLVCFFVVVVLVLALAFGLFCFGFDFNLKGDL